MSKKSITSVNTMVLLLFFIGISVGGMQWIDWTFKQASNDAHIVDTLGRQRMLSQAMGKSILSYTMARSSLQIMQNRIRILDSYIDSMRRIYSAYVVPPAEKSGLIHEQFAVDHGESIPVSASFTRLVNDAFGDNTGMSVDVISLNPVNPKKKIATVHAQEAWAQCWPW